ncbi:unnamed protein product [Brachionus calyciflorus]|uniref:MULE transposase domain-containing protein n=1 Tax=Brachionus calyciflorus TaxID=104777 RepID=A0A814Q8L6_9BILA|nr:unnamed protein product [Brachionus calyciflorus]
MEKLIESLATGYTFTDKIGETDVKFYITNENHFETPDNTRFEKLEHRRFWKERAANSDDKPRKIINLAERPYEDNVLAQLPSYSADRQAIVREQKRNKPQYPKQPEILSEIEVPDWLKMSLKNEDFLFYDSGPSDMDRLLIFFENEAVPIGYSLLPRKNHIIYVKMLKQLRDGLELYPKSITTDCEKAFINAVEEVFSTSKIFGCYFHFKQSMYLNKALVLPECLAYLPVDDVIDGLNEVKESNAFLMVRE